MMWSFTNSTKFFNSLLIINALLLLFSFKNSGLDFEKANFYQSNPQSYQEDFKPSTLEPSQELFTITNSFVSSSSDEAEEYVASGEVDLSSSDLELIEDSGR